ncbi:exodeoxyribonuclease V subunit beta [Marinobacter orientalis]|uniref:RecBCD enzyme subunit RecB n=1 Tax=Marinobacter orientalis TaxID=1928859 RepID=A0A7Y0NL74_9GAMM|nr:exodeoxyribonuclease V subunit beta [Marinobacter orientalis]NMT63064.1 exodeoxyribonuclease V subunit beta [Marinobacter orientalis]TGX51724.1 exodeoxyribonuclease V subunit beta [Marinobacter orientalis]
MTGSVRKLDPLTLPLRGSQLIEASAGTGKTFTLALLYVRLVLGHRTAEEPLGEGIMPPYLLVVTFTEAATKELRDRIRARLTEAAALFAIDPDTVDTTATTKDPLVNLRNACPEADWPACRRKLLLAAEWMDEAAVSTIHGWCNRMLSEHAFDSGSLFRQTLETSQTDLLDNVVRDYWRTFVYPLPPELMNEVLDTWKTPESLRQSVRNLLPHVNALPVPQRDPVAAAEAAKSRREERLQELKAPWPVWCDELDELLAETGKGKPRPLHGATRNSIQKAVDLLREWATTDAAEPPDFLTSKRPRGFDTLEADAFAEKWAGDDEPPHHPAMDAIAELKPALKAMPVAKPDILNHAACWIARRLDSEKQRLASMGFDDLLTRLDEALGGPQGERLAETIRRQFPVAMIDEFQDTDPVQYRIFDRIYRVASNDQDTSLLMIGDPKQAIYGFRGADIHTYLDARHAVSSRTYTLGTNFRSAVAMVDGVNRVFARADQSLPEGAFMFRAGDDNPLPFNPVNAKGTDRQWCVQGQPQSPLTFWTLADERPIAREAGRETMADVCSGQIARLLNLGQAGEAGFSAGDQSLEPLRPGHIAILVNKRDEADAVRQALGARGIRSVYLSDRNSVLQSAQALELLQWLQACAEPGQLSLIRAALATPTMGLAYQDLDRLLSDENALDREINRFQGYRELWQQQGVLPTLRRLLMDYEVPAKLLAGPDGERGLTDILHIAELLQQDSQQLDGEHALIHHYTEMLRESDDEDEHRTMRLESDAGLVKVVTVHKSKGLEYPLVFLPFATEFREEKSNQAFIKYHDDNGKLRISLEPDDDTLARADRERLGEDIRKFYVALTRSRHATWVGAAGIKGWRQSGLGHLVGRDAAENDTDLTPFLQAMAAGEPAIEVAPVPEPGDDVYVGEAEPELGKALEPVREARENWWIASYSAITYGARSGFGDDFAPASEDAEQENLREEDETAGTDIAAVTDAGATVPQPFSQHSFPRGAGPGTFLHDILEWCATRGFGKVAEQPDELYELLERRCNLRNWSDWANTVKTWVHRVITMEIPLPDSGGTCSLASLETLRPEMEFWFESREVNTRTMDKLVCHYTQNGENRPQAHETTFNGMLKGFIDLVFEHEGRYYVLDYKSNFLGEDDQAYIPGVMKEKILENRYDLQYVIYLLALHRLLKSRLPDYDYDTHVGGAVYLFLRGCDAPGAGAFTERPGRTLIEQLDRLFSGQGEKAA